MTCHNHLKTLTNFHQNAKKLKLSLRRYLMMDTKKKLCRMKDDLQRSYSWVKMTVLKKTTSTSTEVLSQQETVIEQPEVKWKISTIVPVWSFNSSFISGENFFTLFVIWGLLCSSIKTYIVVCVFSQLVTTLLYSFSRLEICQKKYMTGFYGQKIYTLRVRKLRRFWPKKKQRKWINISYFSSFFVKI